MTAKVKLVKAAERRFVPIGDPPSGIMAGRDVWVEDSTTLGCGYYTYEAVSMAWTLTYDEYFYCVDGSLTLKTAEADYVMEPGDGMWLPAGTELVYECPGRASVVVAIYPVDYQARAVALAAG